MQKPILTVSALIHAPIEKVWDNFNDPKHIVKWNAASDSWHCPKATNDLKVGGSFSHTMSAKDESMSFDMNGTFTNIIELKQLAYTLEDGREVSVDFRPVKNGIIIEQHFESEGENNIEQQLSGWQAIIDNFKTYVES